MCPAVRRHGPPRSHPASVAGGRRTAPPAHSQAHGALSSGRTWLCSATSGSHPRHCPALARGTPHPAAATSHRPHNPTCPTTPPRPTPFASCAGLVSCSSNHPPRAPAPRVRQAAPRPARARAAAAPPPGRFQDSDYAEYAEPIPDAARRREAGLKAYEELKDRLARRGRTAGGLLALYLFLTTSGEAALSSLLGSAAGAAYLAWLFRDVDSVNSETRVPLMAARAEPAAPARAVKTVLAAYWHAANARLLIPVALGMGVGALGAAQGRLPLLEAGCLLLGFLSSKARPRVGEAGWAGREGRRHGRGGGGLGARVRCASPAAVLASQPHTSLTPFPTCRPAFSGSFGTT